jgi:hypothetical protein
MRALLLTLIALFACAACTAGEADPTTGTYTVAFPSTAAAVATDIVQVLVFDVDDANRASRCQDLITARLTSPASLEPSLTPPALPLCEMLARTSTLDLPYGEHAFLAVAQKKDRDDNLRDFMIGCSVMTIGDGDAPLPIPVRLVSVNLPVPPTDCTTVGEYCAGHCEL